ncbi:cytochrome c oxidase assembly factor CtaG [Bacillus sp. FJAT-44742]|uniref:cytochrome c oxidase assembly factor CtaG n=1 Tax=Bacillus sp. FJAT-44742 TaxID=2014005 RepID=UPI000C250B1F|nr:cytochrome c oxidase assembly factor CtaG [Bacillus sp. FJAT-44742]
MGEFFSTFSIRALWTPELFIILLGLIVLYYLLIEKWSVHFINSKPVPMKQKVYFGLALAALYLGWGSPLYVAGHMILSLHMAQMLFAYFVAVPLFIASMPKWFLQTVMHRWKKRSPVSYKIIMSPIVGLITFNALFSFYHFPFVFDTLMLSPGWHSVYEIALFAGAWLMWWHMIAPLPDKDQLPELRRIAYIFGNSVLITPACALIIFAGEPLYATYTDSAFWANVMAYCLPAGATVPAGMFNWSDGFQYLDTLNDQQLAGVTMKIVQEITYGVMMGVIFKQWLTKEKTQDGELTISDLPTANLNQLKGQ